MSHRVLLCDDEMHILRAAEYKLKKSGYDVQCEEDGQAAWEAICESKPDILVTDYHMPRLDGLGLCRKIRESEETKDLPIIMLTAKGFEFTSDDNLDALDIAAMMGKPFSPRGLTQCIQEILDTGSYAAPPMSVLR